MSKKGSKGFEPKIMPAGILLSGTGFVGQTGDEPGFDDLLDAPDGQNSLEEPGETAGE